MASIMTKRGSVDNIVTYEHICDTTADMSLIDPRYVTLGSTCIVVQGESGGLEVYMASTNKEWQSLVISNGGSGAGGIFDFHICTEEEIDASGKPDIEEPSTTTVYLVPGEQEDTYTKYIYTDSQWVEFDGTTIDLSDYVKKVEGKGLSTNDFTDAYKTKIDAAGETASNAGYHNSIYRGKYLGTSITSDQWNEIKNGTFNDLYIGDYWTINGTDYVICHFDYYYNRGSSPLTLHHIIVMPRSGLVLDTYSPSGPNAKSYVINDKTFSAESTSRFRWNYQYDSSNDQLTHYSGLYTNSHIYTDILPIAENKIGQDVGIDHLLFCEKLLPNSCDNDCKAISYAWTTNSNTYIDLCSETQVFGQRVWSESEYEVGVDNIQLAIFKLDPDFMIIKDQNNQRVGWWLRSVPTKNAACLVHYYGYSNSGYTNNIFALRPLCILGLQTGP